MLEALANRFPEAYLTNTTLHQLQSNLSRTTPTSTTNTYGTTIPSKHHNKTRSGRANRRQQRSQQALQAVGGIAGHWTKAANTTKYPIGYEMCKIEHQRKGSNR